MGKITGFMDFGRTAPERRPPAQRVADYREYYHRWTDAQAKEQGGRCMDCAVPFCHMGCPLGNVIPEFNHQVWLGNWQGALEVLLSTNNFPEFTGRICPAPCEASCVLSINADPVTIEYIEKEISDRGFEQGWIQPAPPDTRTGKTVAVVGSGPSGLAAAQQLNRAGHSVTVLERADYIGGLLMLGIPDFKLDKDIVRRRVSLMAAEGVEFRTGVNVGVNYPAEKLLREYDAICLTGGSTQARDLPVPGRELDGVHFAMEYLPQQNRKLAGETVPDAISAEGPAPRRASQIQPVMPTKYPASNHRSKSSRVPVKQWISTSAGAMPLAARMRAVSPSVSRSCTKSGRRNAAASSAWARNTSRCAAAGE